MLIGGEEVLAIVGDDAQHAYNRGCEPAPASSMMSASKLTLLATLALLGGHLIGAEATILEESGERIKNLEDRDLRRVVESVMEDINPKMEIIRIISAKKQEVGGVKYIVEFVGRVRPCTEMRFYSVSYVIKPWISEDPLDIEFHTIIHESLKKYNWWSKLDCQVGSLMNREPNQTYECMDTAGCKFTKNQETITAQMKQRKEKPALVGGFKDVENLDDADLKSSLATVVSKQNANVEIVKIISAKTQIVAGIKYFVEFLGRVRPSDEMKTYTASYVLQPWLSKEPQHVVFNTKS